MIHQPIGATQGQAIDIDIHAREIMRLKDAINELFALHTGQNKKRIGADTERDFFMGGKEALEYGIVDKVIAKREMMNTENYKRSEGK